MRAAIRRAGPVPAGLGALLLVLLLAPLPAGAQAAPASQPAATSAAQVSLDALDPVFASGRVGSFAKENLASFSSFRLSNGIPVILRRNEANRVLSLSLVIRGGSLLSTPAEAGLESLMLRTMARGSADWPYAKLRAKLDETSASFSASSSFEYSIYSLGCLDRYFAELLPIWADSVVKPGWDPGDFDRVLSDAKLALQKKEQDPWQATATEMNLRFFAGHPYAANPEGTLESLASLDLAKVKARYPATFSANRLFVVAVGNFDLGALKAGLEKSLGGLPDLKVPLPAGAPPFLGAVKAGLDKKDFAASKGIAYLRGDFAAPAPGDPDWAAASLAARIFSDLLFNVVRDKYGAAYTPGAVVRAFGSNYGSISVFKTSAPDKIKSYLDEAAAEFAAGRALAVAPGPEAGRFPRAPIAEVLPIYKTIFINETYSSITTNAAVAGEIARSVLQFGDPRAWLLDVDKVQAVKPEELLAAFQKYFVRAPIFWVALGPEDLLSQIPEAAFPGLGAKP